MEFFNIEDEICCKDLNVLGEIFCDILGSLRYECILAAYLDDDMVLRGMVEVARGTGARVDSSIRDIYMCAFHYSARKIVLAHNHPAGKLLPSSGDILSTNGVARILSLNNVTLLEHFLICGDEYCAFFGKERSLT